MSSNEKLKLAVFDIDGTIFRNSLFIELHWKLVRRGIIPRGSIKKLDSAYWSWVKREGHYDDYLNEVIDNFHEHIVGKTEREVQAGVKKVIEVQSNIVYRYTRDLISELRKTCTLIAISGSPAFIVEEFSRFWGFDHWMGTEYEVEEKKYTGKVLSIPVENKKNALTRMVDEHGFSLGGSIGVGDTESDVGMLELVEKPICFNPTAKLYEVAKKNKWRVVLERKDQIYIVEDGKIIEH